MFDRRSMAQVRTVMGGGISKSKLVTAMLDILLQLPVGTSDLKNTIINNLGFTSTLASSRDINTAWNEVKKKQLNNIPINLF